MENKHIDSVLDTDPECLEVSNSHENTTNREYKVLMYGFPILIILAITFLFVGLFYGLRNNTVVDNPASKTLAKKEKKIEDGNKKLTNEKEKRYQIYRSDGLNKDKVYEFPGPYRSKLLRWRDKLIMGTEVQSNDSTKIKVVMHDIVTGKNVLLFEKKTQDKQISEFIVIKDVLYFSLGGYLVDGEMYYVDLMKISSFEKISDIPNAHIIQKKNHYWVVGGNGDSCWNKHTLALLDLEKKTVTIVAESVSGCQEGEEYVDVDSQDNLVMAYHDSQSFVYDESDTYSGFYKYVISTPLSDPKTKNGLISKQDMPDGITSIKYSSHKNELILAGKELFTYDLLSGKLEKKMTIPKNWLRSEISQIGENFVCLWKLASGEDSFLMLNMITSQMYVDTLKCTLKPDHNIFANGGENNPPISPEEQFVKLNLPSNYALLLE
ncbi:MAG: hypothetical protein U0525_01350 [Patescibacteria group bacterium]